MEAILEQDVYHTKKSSIHTNIPTNSSAQAHLFLRLPLQDQTTNYILTSLIRFTEVETYACVMNTFRAQGSLSQQKLNLLADLRNLLKIGQDRHRAETRRATNDELLSTIAEK